MKPLYCLLRDRCGLTITEAAEFHRTSRNTVTKWSSGGRNPPDGVVVELQELYRLIKAAARGGISVDKLPFEGAKDAARGIMAAEQ